MTNVQNITHEKLAQCWSTENYYAYNLLGIKLQLTDGVQYVRLNGAAWLIDAIASHQTTKKVRQEEFQAWTLKKTTSEELLKDPELPDAVLTCTDGNYTKLARQEIEYTDFPLDEIKFYLINGVLLLTSEY